VAFQVKQFFFEPYGPGGVSVLVREGGAPTGSVVAETTLDVSQFQELLDYIGYKPAQSKPDVAEKEEAVVAYADKLALSGEPEKALDVLELTDEPEKGWPE
jgi:hypothetical protein